MKNKENPAEEKPYTGKTYAYISIAMTVAGAVAFGLAFTVPGIYALISSVLLSLTALAFANVQKRKNNFKQLIFIRIAGYVLLCVTTAFFTGGIIWSAIK